MRVNLLVVKDSKEGSQRIWCYDIESVVNQKIELPMKGIDAVTGEPIQDMLVIDSEAKLLQVFPSGKKQYVEFRDVVTGRDREAAQAMMWRRSLQGNLEYVPYLRWKAWCCTLLKAWSFSDPTWGTNVDDPEFQEKKNDFTLDRSGWDKLRGEVQQALENAVAAWMDDDHPNWNMPLTIK